MTMFSLFPSDGQQPPLHVRSVRPQEPGHAGDVRWMELVLQERFQHGSNGCVQPQ